MNPKYLWEGRHLRDKILTLTPRWPKPSTGALLFASPTYLLFFGWYPQKEMFFSWKKWLHLFPYRRDERSKTVSLHGKQAGGANRERVGTRGGKKHVGQRAGWGLKSPWPPEHHRL